MSASKAARRPNGDGSVYFDHHKQRWIAAITDPDGKRHKRSAKSQKDANARLRELQDEVRDTGRVASPHATVNDLVELWKAKVLAAATSAPSTKATKRWACDRIERALGAVRLVQLTPDRIEQALQDMADEGLSRESLIKVRSVLNQICKFGERRDLMRRNPVRVVELPAGLTRSDDGRALTAAQAQHLLTVAATDRLHALWCTMMMLGLRPGEALGLHWCDIDLAGGTLHVRRALRDGVSGLEVTENLKTTRSRRGLTMPDPVVAALKAHRALQRRERELAAEAWSREWPDLVFTTLRGTPIDPSNLRRQFAKLTETAGLGRWSPNELRHTAVSLLSEAGVPLERIADVVGHDGTRMTYRVYRHVLSPTVEHAAAPMNQLFAAAAG